MLASAIVTTARSLAASPSIVLEGTASTCSVKSHHREITCRYEEVMQPALHAQSNFLNMSCLTAAGNNVFVILVELRDNTVCIETLELDVYNIYC
jgi:hypothetical protein